MTIKEIKKINLKKKDSINNQFHTCHYLPFLLKILFKKKKISFLDYGAGTFKNYHYLRNYLNKLKYYFKDQSIVENYFINKKNKLKDLNIYKKQKDISFLYFGSSFQYIDKGEKILDNIIKSNNLKYIFFSAINLYEKGSEDKIIFKQNNIPNKKIFLYFYRKKYLVNYLNKKGFKLVFCMRNNSDEYLNYNNLDKKKYQYSDILFKKIKF